MKDLNKATVTRMHPETLINAIEGLPLSIIMKGNFYKLVSIVIKKVCRTRKISWIIYRLQHPISKRLSEKGLTISFFNLLKDSGILECNNICYKGTAYGYRICKDLLEGEWETVKYIEKFNNEIGALNCLESQEYMPTVENTKRYFQGYSNPNIQCDISLVSSVPFFPHISSSIFLPISTCLFSKDIVYDDLRSLMYDVDKIIDHFAYKISSPSTLGLISKEDITTPLFEVYSPKYNFKWYTKLENAIAKA